MADHKANHLAMHINFTTIWWHRGEKHLHKTHTEILFLYHKKATNTKKHLFNHIKIKEIEMKSKSMRTLTEYVEWDVPCQRVILQWSDECKSCE